MSSYKLTYFDVRARGETTRMMFVLADQKFEDNRVTRTEWLKLKPESPFGQMPMLEVDGVKICQSHAIERLVAKRFGFYGNNDLEQAVADMVIDCIEDMRRPLTQIRKSEGDVREQLKKKYTEEQFPLWIVKLDQMVNKHGYFVGNKVSWPDLFWYNVYEFANRFVDTSPYMANASRLKALIGKVEADPKIAAWLAKRPDATHEYTDLLLHNESIKH